MKLLKLIVATVAISFVLTSCFEDMDDNPASTADLNNFVWRGLNTYYLYKDNVPDLANDRFASNAEYQVYLNNYSSPEELFNHLRYQPETIDRFSWITSDYIALEQQLNGTTYSNGMEFGLFRFSENDTNVYGYVRYINPGTSAESNGLQRGMLFNAVNGTQLTINNWSGLLAPNIYTIGLADYDDNGTTEIADDTVNPNGQSVTLSKVPYTENPIYKTDIFQVAGKNVGYLMYNGFTAPFDSQLNSVFGNFLANNVQELVLDLRYNPGGSVNTATLLGSMITGQFNGNIFSKLVYNNDRQDENKEYYFSNNFNGMHINQLNLNRIYIIATGSSASASEMIINSLRPYIEVIHIGSNTVGKTQASRIVYDSPNFNRQYASPTHTYALLPLVAIGLNSSNQSVPPIGLTPDIEIVEDFKNLGLIGNSDEPLLATALQHILDHSRPAGVTAQPFELVGDSNDFVPSPKDMYIDKQLP